MTFLPKPTEGGDFTPPPAGTFPAICYRLLDLGTQAGTYKGDTKIQHKILLSWELKDEDCMMQVDGQSQPMTIHQRYTWSMHEKATLRKTLEHWRGAKFKESDFGPGGFDIRKLLGAPCTLSVVHNTNGEKTFANVASVGKLARGMQTGKLVNPTRFLWLSREAFDPDVFSELSQGLQDTIKKSPEYQELFRPGAGAEVSAAKFDKQYSDQEIPF